jgi:prepilin-type N-terminal cleavage/methylation domain-containing protein
MRRGFSLIELLVVLSVVTVLTGLLMPAIRGVRESANRMVCASNQRQIGAAITMWATEHSDRLPPSHFGSKEIAKPQEMMAATRSGDVDGVKQWEGLGWLVHWHCLDNPEALYCPSCRGDHPYSRYSDNFAWKATEPVLINYHYSGDFDQQKERLRTIANSAEEVYVTDGLRTVRDFNHLVGANVLRGDCSVNWYQDDTQKIQNTLPEGPIDTNEQKIVYGKLWGLLFGTSK